MPPQAAANVRQMEPGSSGFVDPWCLVEKQFIPRPAPPDLDSKIPPPPQPSPNSGEFYLFPHKAVFAEPTGEATMPVERGADSGYTVDLTGHPLANPPRLESYATIERGEFLACKVTGLESALAAPPPPTPTTETDATQSEPAKADTPTSAKPAATTPTAPKSVPVTAAK